MRHVSTRHPLLSLALGVVLLTAACGDSDGDGDADVDTVAVATQRVERAQAAFDESQDAFCADTATYIAAIDRYGKAFNDDAATVGDVRTAGRDLEGPRDAVTSSATGVVSAQAELTEAEQALAEAEAAEAGAAPPTSTTSEVELLPPATVDAVQTAESDFASADEGFTDDTPLSEATAAYNAAAFAVEVAWLRVLSDAGCLTEEQQSEATSALVDYTVSLQTALQASGYYDGAIDGIYGASTVAGVEALQTDSGLTVTGLVDEATGAALDAAVAAAGNQAATDVLTYTASVQTLLKVGGYWPGAIDGVWTPELTDAVVAMQTELGVPPTGVVDPATLSAIWEQLAALETASNTTTTTAGPDTTTTAPPDGETTTTGG